jgi:hypothetical protein
MRRPNEPTAWVAPEEGFKSYYFFPHILEQGGLLGRCARNTETSAVNPAGAMLQGRIGTSPGVWQRILFFFPGVAATAHPMRGLASVAGFSFSAPNLLRR